MLAAVNVGTWQFAAAALGPRLGFDPATASPALALGAQIAAVVAITALAGAREPPRHPAHHPPHRLQRLLDPLRRGRAHRGHALLRPAPVTPSHLVTFTNYSGARGGGVWPATSSVPWLFLLGFLLPAYTITGFDASAHTAEETVGAVRQRPPRDRAQRPRLRPLRLG